jgi:hypothetical protein
MGVGEYIEQAAKWLADDINLANVTFTVAMSLDTVADVRQAAIGLSQFGLMVEMSRENPRYMTVNVRRNVGIGEHDEW